MRPKKVILLLMESEDDLCELRFILETLGHAVVGSRSPEVMIGRALGDGFDLAILEIAKLEAGDAYVLDWLRRHRSAGRILFLGQPDGSGMDSTVDFKKSTKLDLLARIIPLLGSKRGPKPGTPGAMRCGQAARERRERTVENA
jgi:hypothetical protein